jgi:hypothetical protein
MYNQTLGYIDGKNASLMLKTLIQQNVEHGKRYRFNKSSARNMVLVGMDIEYDNVLYCAKAKSCGAGVYEIYFERQK